MVLKISRNRATYTSHTSWNLKDFNEAFCSLVLMFLPSPLISCVLLFIPGLPPPHRVIF